MCACRPNVRTPNCGGLSCLSVAAKLALLPALAFLRSEAARFRERNEGADAAVAAHFEIAADRIERADLTSQPRTSTASPEGNAK